MNEPTGTAQPADAGQVDRPVGRLVAYEVDDEPTIYAATSAVHAANLYAEDTGALPDDGYPRELTEAELDAPRAADGPNEATTIRQWLAAETEAGLLCCADR